MSLEDDVRNDIDRAACAVPKALEARVAGNGREVLATTDEIVAICLARTKGLEDAVMRLARELEGLRSPGRLD